MSNASLKLEYRTKIMSILNKYRDNSAFDNIALQKDIETIKALDDKKIVLKILLDEIIDVKSDFSNVCAVIAIETVDKDTLETCACEFLSRKDVSDDRKFFFISILKQKGIQFDYDEISNHISHPDEVAQNGVKDFLNNALDDPEAQIDLLDFYLNISKSEKIYLLNNLINEFEGDDLANAFSLLSRLDIENDEIIIIINGLIKTDSPYALDGLEYILENYEVGDILKKSIKQSIRKLKFKYKNFQNLSFCKNSSVLKCYMSFVDGESNFSLIISRLKKTNLIDAALLTININRGIVACVGFGKITIESLKSIINRTFINTMPVEISPITYRALCDYYILKNKKTLTRPPYEYIVWEKMSFDIKKLNCDLSEFLNAKLDTLNLTEQKVRKFISSKMLETWYYYKGQDKRIDDILNEIEQNHICDLNMINKIVSDEIEKDFINNPEYIKELQTKLLLQAYAARQCRLKVSSACAYSLCFKNPYIKMLIESIIDKSIYYHLSNCLHEKQETNKENMFKKTLNSKFSIEELEDLMNKLEAKWS